MYSAEEYERLMHELEHKSLILQTVNRIASVILQSRADRLEENLRQSMLMLAEVASADRVYIWKNHRRDGLLYCSQVYEWSGGAEPQQHLEFAAETSYRDRIPRWEERLSRGLCINDIVRGMPENEQAALSPQGILSILVVPLFLENSFWGFVGFDDCRRERIFSENDETVLRSASGLIAAALSHARLEAEADKIFDDPLTGIRNRRFFDERVRQLLRTLSRSGGDLTLMMVDVDHFKRYNDVHGHVEGDACLRNVAEVLRSCVTRADDFVARYGGEEFVVVLPHTDAAGGRAVARRLLESVRERGGVTVSIGVATGVVTGAAGRGRSESDFVRRADEMLYASKQGGRDRYTFGEMPE